MQLAITKRLTNFLIAILFLSFLGFVFYFLTDYSRKYNSYLDYQNDLLSSSIDETLHTYESFSGFIFTSEINKESVLSLVAQAGNASDTEKAVLRNTLYSQLSGIYALAQQYNFRQLQFHLPNGDSFLRFHSPEKFGDNLFSTRESVRLANEEKRVVSGFEEGRIMNGYRFVYPLNYQGEHIGSVEVSVSMSSVVDELYRKNMRRDIGFILEKSLMRKTVDLEEQVRYEDSFVSDDYVLDAEVFESSKNSKNSLKLYEDEAFNQIFKTAVADELKTKESFDEVLSYNGKRYLVQYLAIKDVSGTPAGYLFCISERSYIKDLETGRALTLLFSGLILFMFAFLFIIILKRQKLVAEISMRDQLTRVYNRATFFEFAKKAVARQQRTKCKLSLAMIDIDHFKKVNDSFGHSVGDSTLKALADIVAGEIRGTDVFARFGGEEFILLLPDTDLDAAEIVVERIRQKVEDFEFPKAKTVTISCGVTNKRNDEAFDNVIKRADEALYLAKDSGRNKVVKLLAQ